MSVIVPTYRRFEPLLRTLEDLLAQDYPAFEIIVADQNPEWPRASAEARATVEADPRVRWLTIDRPGVVAARNRAVAVSRGAILLFVDDDVFAPARTLIRRHVANFANERIAVVVGRERQVGDPAPDERQTNAPSADPGLASQGSPLQQALWFDRNSDAPRYVCTFCTCNGSIRRSAFLAVGGFDELFAGNSYGDDYDLALRLHAFGFRAVYDPSAWLIHRRVPMGGLRMTDAGNRIDHGATMQGVWLFVLRHGHRGMYGHLILHHVLRKTVLLKRNLKEPWRQPAAAFYTVSGLVRAWIRRTRRPESPFAARAAA